MKKKKLTEPLILIGTGVSTYDTEVNKKMWALPSRSLQYNWEYM